MSNWKILEVNVHTHEKVILYRGSVENDAAEAYHKPRSLPYGEKRVYKGTKQMYPYELPSCFFQWFVSQKEH